LNPWDERYGAASYFYGTEPNDFLREHAAKIAPTGDVLCLAEGEGRNAVFLARQGLRVVAVDQSATGLEKAAQLASGAGVQVTTVESDLGDYSIVPSRWDAIVAIWCHLPPQLRAAVHAQVVAGLKPGGLLLLEAYRPAQLAFGTGGPPTAELMPTLAQLRVELVGLELELAEELERDVQEGRGHSGPSAVVQVIARRRA
jgi:SAM-dependent methyltransferase